MWAHLGSADPRIDRSEPADDRDDLTGVDRRLALIAILAAALALAGSLGFGSPHPPADTSPSASTVDARP